MPTNTQTIAAIVGGTVPPDMLCVRDGQDVVDLVAAVCTVAVNLALIPGGSGDSIAQLALETANIALATAQAAQAAIPQRRTQNTPVSIPTGDSAMPITFSPAMPDGNYEVRGTYYGTAAYPAQAFSFHVEDGSRTENGCTIRLNNTPANFKFAWVVEALAT